MLLLHWLLVQLYLYSKSRLLYQVPGTTRSKKLGYIAVPGTSTRYYMCSNMIEVGSTVKVATSSLYLYQVPVQ